MLVNWIDLWENNDFVRFQIFTIFQHVLYINKCMRLLPEKRIIKNWVSKLVKLWFCVLPFVEVHVLWDFPKRGGDRERKSLLNHLVDRGDSMLPVVRSLILVQSCWNAIIKIRISNFMSYSFFFRIKFWLKTKNRFRCSASFRIFDIDILFTNIRLCIHRFR